MNHQLIPWIIHFLTLFTFKSLHIGHYCWDESFGEAAKQLRPGASITIQFTAFVALIWLTRPCCHWTWSSNINLSLLSLLPWVTCQGHGAFDVIEIRLKQTMKVPRIITHRWCRIPFGNFINLNWKDLRFWKGMYLLFMVRSLTYVCFSRQWQL